MKSNTVYLLTNVSVSKGKRFYIGSKQEASIELFDGVMTILDRDGKPYYSSSTSVEMREEMRRGDVFEASLLKDGISRERLLEVENNFIMKANAVASEEYYNKTNAVLNCHDQEAVANKFGETVKELAGRNSSWSKRDSTAKKLGFDNFGLLHLWVKTKKEEGLTHAAMSRLIGQHRHFSSGLIRGINLEKALLEIENKALHQDKLRDLILAGCSLYYACEIMRLEITSGRVILGDFNKKYERAFSVARKRSKTKEEMEDEIINILITSEDGYGNKKAAKALGVSLDTVRRYLSRWLKRNVNPNNLKINP